MRATLITLACWLAGCLLTAGCATAPRPQSAAPWPPADEASWAFSAAQLADQTGRFDQAVDYYRRALAQDPGSALLRRYLVRDLIRLERYPEARLEYQALVDQHPEDHETQAILGQLCEAVGDTKLAETLYRSALTLQADDSGLNTRLGRLLLGLDQTGEALHLLRRALALDPRNHEARQLLVTYYQGLQPARAEKLLEEGLELEPDDPEWLSQMGELLEQEGRLEDTAEVYRQLVEADQQALPAFRFLSVYYLKRGEWAKARWQLERLLHLVPKDAAGRRNLGLALYNLGLWSEAREQLNVVLATGQADALTHHLLGAIFQHEGLHYLAADEFREAVRMDPNLMEARLGLSAALLAAQERAKAEAAAEEAARAFPSEVLMQINYGVVLLRVGKPGEAVEVFRRALRLGDQRARIYFHLGQAQLEQKQFEQAVASWTTAVKLDPHFAEAFNYLAYTHAERGLKLAQAQQWVKRALALDPENPNYLDTLAWVQYQQGRYAKALETILSALKQYQARAEAVDPAVYEHLGDIYYQLENYQEASQAWQSALKLKPDNQQLRQKLRQLPGPGGGS
ncbi:MAG: tetratricopeptide repeat protein [candidate division FCPU426 bacterium]